MAESLTAPVTDALRRLRRGTGVSLAFGGVVHGSRGLRLRHFVGDTHGALNGVAVDAGHGLGGKVIALDGEATDVAQRVEAAIADAQG